MRVNAVLFDLGGTLFAYDGRVQMGRATVNALERLGLSLDDPAVRDARRVASEQIEREYAPRRSFLHRDLFRDRIVRTAALLGLEMPDDVCRAFDEEQREAVIAFLAPRPDARETLLGLRARGIYTAVVSNADDDYLGPVLQRHALDALVDDWTSSEEADSCKPDGKIFQYSLNKARRSASETLFVGDSLAHDVAGAHRAGMCTVLIGEPSAVAPLSHGLHICVADFEVRALVEIIAIVDQCNAAS